MAKVETFREAIKQCVKRINCIDHIGGRAKIGLCSRSLSVLECHDWQVRKLSFSGAQTGELRTSGGFSFVADCGESSETFRFL